MLHALGKEVVNFGGIWTWHQRAFVSSRTKSSVACVGLTPPSHERVPRRPAHRVLTVRVPEHHRLSAESIEVWSLHESLAESVVHQRPRIVHHHEDHTFTRILHDIVALAHAWVASARLPDDRAVVLHAASRRVAVLKARCLLYTSPSPLDRG